MSQSEKSTTAPSKQKATTHTVEHVAHGRCAAAEGDRHHRVVGGGTRRTEVAEHVLTSDGATRLIVTAYIGIGNRLFIRGEGPGLSWEKGVPLQFVSIGKWRWETSEATAPITFRLFKNDTVECTALGEQSIIPGHLTEVTAAF